MTSPEGRLRCGRPSAFVPAILPPPINSNFGASPTLFYPPCPSPHPLPPPPRSPPPVLSSSRDPSSLFLSLSPLSLRIYTLFRALPSLLRDSPFRGNLTSCFFVHMSHRPCLEGISFIFLPLCLSYDAAPLAPVRALYLGFVCDCGSGACQALLYMGDGSNDA